MKTNVPFPADITHQRAAAPAAAARQTRNEAAFVDDRPIETMQRRINEIVDSSPRVMQHRALAEMIDNSPRVAQRRALSAYVDHSPHMAAQSDRVAQLSGGALQRVDDDEENLSLEDEPAIQEKSAAGAPAAAPHAPAPKPNDTGLPNQLKSGIESISGLSMDHVKVHYNSSQPAQLNALAYAQGSEIHLGPGQERHLPHEAWHVVQQAQGRVRPSMQMAGAPINDDPGLEREADDMGGEAAREGDALQRAAASDAAHSLPDTRPHAVTQRQVHSTVIQRIIGEGSVLLRGRKVKSKSGTIYEIINDHVFRSKLEYLLCDDDGNEFYVAFDDPRYDLAGDSATSSDDDVDFPDDDGGFADEFDDDERYDDGSGSEDDEPAVTLKVWDLVSIKKALKSSTEFAPLSYVDIAGIEKWLDEHLSAISRPATRELSLLIKTARKHLDQYQLLSQSTRPSKKVKRRSGKEAATATTFSDASSSELSSEEDNPDVRLERYPVSMASFTGRSHVYGIEDNARFNYLVTGLPYADTYLGLFRNGSLVPRNINGEPNKEGMRKRMRDVEKRIGAAIKKRDALFTKLGELNKGLDSKKGPELAAAIEERDRVFAALQAVLRDEIRPHVESIVFGSSSSLNPTNEDIDETAENSEARETIRTSLLKERVPSAAAETIREAVPRGISTGADSGTHAEQSLINTRTWSELVNRMFDMISDSKDAPEEMSAKSITTLQLVINRSTCIGCARELTVELIRFWTQVAEVAGLKNWRQAKYAYEDYVRFMIDFPAIYEGATEKGTGNANITRIVLGLRDAGWQVRVFSGIETKTDSDSTNREAKALIHGIASTPMYYVPKWNEKIVCFPIPKALTAEVEAHGMMLINGIRYWRTKDGKSLTRIDEHQKTDISASDIEKMVFLTTGANTGENEGEEEKKTARKPQSDLAKLYGKLSSGASLGLSSRRSTAYDPVLEVMLGTGYHIENVSGRGMNCLIRSIFLAAGIQFDEGMVKIVRHFLVSRGLTDDGDMLDLIGHEGDALIEFLQRQGVLLPGTGITVHFSGNSMVVSEGEQQIHLWFGGAHFQAIVPNK